MAASMPLDAQAELPPANALMAKNDPTFEAGKNVDDFRVYHRVNDNSWNAGVLEHYTQMRTNQTVEFVERMLKFYACDTFGKRVPTPAGMEVLKRAGFDPADFADGVRLTIADMFKVLEGYVDRSDPDTEDPNIFHFLQTAERAREAGEPEDVVLACFIHDMGKAMFLWDNGKNGQTGTATGEQWALGGDTFVVGAQLPASCVYPELNALSPDMKDDRYNTPNGKYEPGCGIMALQFAYGHDQYIHDFCLANDIRFSGETMAFLRLHSCYPWHRGGAYRHFMKDGDEKLLEAVLRCNKYDLYSKSDAKPDPAALWPYYQGLIDKFCPGKLKW